MKKKVSLSTGILTVLLLLVSVVLWNFPAAAASVNSHIGNINTFNKQRAAHFANEMRIKLTKMANNKISPAYSDFYEEEFDHFQRNYQTNVNYYYSYTFSQEDENKYKSGSAYGTAYLKAWFPAVSANGMAVYKYWAVGPGGVVSGYRYAPCGAFVPEKHAPQAINFTLSFTKAK